MLDLCFSHSEWRIELERPASRPGTSSKAVVRTESQERAVPLTGAVRGWKPGTGAAPWPVMPPGSRRLLWALLLPLFPAFGGCGSGLCELAADIVPGCGIMAGDLALRLGDNRGDVQDSFPSLEATWDLDNLGTTFTIPGQGIAGMFEGGSADATLTSISVVPGFSGLTTGGVGLGSGESQVVGEFGQPLVDGYLGAWWYSEHGLGLEWSGASVERIHLFVPGSL